MADRKSAFSSVSSLTLTSANLASSATAGWQSGVLDFTTGNYLDVLVAVDLAAVNTAPANSKGVYLFIAPLHDTSGSVYVTTGSDAITGTGPTTITVPDVTANALPIAQLGFIPYPVQNKQLVAEFSVLEALGYCPEKAVLVMVNHSGMTLSVTSIKWKGLYETVA